MMSKKSPQLRFEGFTDDWEERKLSDVANHRGGTAIEKYFDKDGVYKVISIGSYGLNSQYVDQNIRAISNEITDGRVVNSGELTMVLNDKTANGTIIGRSLLVEKDNEYVINQRTEIISPKENFDSNFAYTILNGPFREKVKRIVQGGTQIYVNYPAVSNLNLELPKIEEQKKIGSFFKQLDDTIALHQRKLDLLKEQKKGFLQKMFPKNGAKVPELRFAGFADDWEEHKLSSGLREYTDRVTVEDDKEYSQISVRNNFGGITLRGSKMGNKIGRKRQAKINLTKYPQTLIFTRQTVEQGGIGWVDKYCDGAIVTENMPTISLDTSVFSKYFLTNLFQTRIFYKNAILDNIEGGSAQIAIHESKFLSSTLLFPNLDEQEKIGSFFKQLDETIALHQRKLDLLKEQKKGFLQKMFV
ncbi:restriction endonuclease subunit S [Lactococcus lactis subsp. lactis]|uniref:restriction endonuclease subunit S n=1 Tax=Lactococcus lactis TaxID=1358 RepID=UPI00223C2429|nr:restriction endonuclease subunit S [Lactococcus lactis]MDV4193162.1 restriction endonuclease subunit S [Lactococcus lactis subsp. lactis]